MIIIIIPVINWNINCVIMIVISNEKYTSYHFFWKQQAEFRSAGSQCGTHLAFLNLKLSPAKRIDLQNKYQRFPEIPTFIIHLR